ncbi:hypothetical protein Zmor_014611 [Zophobas morio]|uniref:Uncharacterized protein n=1 Tax=Zophobas morio TaxID=2755281 RepID=A0AA38IK55_9CUCU|nr:hypothetical protein Zmor_014611 [Zophobas morio]
MYQFLASNGRKLVYGEFFQFRVCRYGNGLRCARTFVSVVHLRDHGIFNLKLRIVAVIGQKEYCKPMNKFWNVTKKSLTSALADLQLKFVSFHTNSTEIGFRLGSYRPQPSRGNLATRDICVLVHREHACREHLFVTILIYST